MYLPQAASLPPSIGAQPDACTHLAGQLSHFPPSRAADVPHTAVPYSGLSVQFYPTPDHLGKLL